MAVFREQLEAADKHLLAAGNFNGCHTIEALKKIVYDYRKKFQIDENVFTECRVTEYAFNTEDVTSKVVQGTFIDMQQLF